MVAESKQLGFAFNAGSSLPVAWRMPAVDMPFGAEVEELVLDRPRFPTVGSDGPFFVLQQHRTGSC